MSPAQVAVFADFNFLFKTDRRGVTGEHTEHRGSKIHSESRRVWVRRTPENSPAFQRRASSEISELHPVGMLEFTTARQTLSRSKTSLSNPCTHKSALHPG